MAKKSPELRMSPKEWEALPLTFGAPVVAKLVGCNLRYVQNHPNKFGGVKVAGKWLFSKPRLAQLLGIDNGRTHD